MTRDEALRRWPRIVAHVIASSLGYATPSLAAKIVADAHDGRENWCEWIASCYGGDAKKAVERAIRRRRSHTDYMASYPQALALVRHSIESGEEPLFASWL